MKRIYLIDCPGVVPPSTTDSEQDILLRGVVRVENVEHPEQYIAAVLAKTKPQHIQRTYELKDYRTPLEFLELLARKGGRLLKGGEADVDGVAKMVLNDFLRGKIPWFTPPPPAAEAIGGEGVAGREGRLGEMGRKRKREVESVTDVDAKADAEADVDAKSEADVDAEGFGDDEEGVEDEDEDEEKDENEVDEVEDQMTKEDVEVQETVVESQTAESSGREEESEATPTR